MLGIAAGGLYLMSRRKKGPAAHPAVLEGPHPSDAPVTEQPLPGAMYKGSNPAPYDDLGMSVQHQWVTGGGINDANRWAVYRHMNGATLIGVAKWTAPSGDGSVILRGPFQDVDDAASQTLDYFEEKRSGT